MISNDSQFREILGELGLQEQRRVAALFVDNVLPLSDDQRLLQIVTSLKEGLPEEALSAPFKEAKATSLEAHTRCGTEGDWDEQAAYFVARATQASVEPQLRSGGKNPAWRAAMQSRMARTCLASESDEDSHNSETTAQYIILNNYLNR
ncbi:MAG: hypothetical protein HN842_10650 [Gammaproteobacteria bacterium]|jgi:hypothetical protein|nr:hypothetical protein [Gammaproteobacteria bacterium]MBT7308667.1 hypothetical protein [Gammaproteobacteria bacterium]